MKASLLFIVLSLLVMGCHAPKSQDQSQQIPLFPNDQSSSALASKGFTTDGVEIISLARVGDLSAICSARLAPVIMLHDPVTCRVELDGKALFIVEGDNTGDARVQAEVIACESKYSDSEINRLQLSCLRD